MEKKTRTTLTKAAQLIAAGATEQDLRAKNTLYDDNTFKQLYEAAKSLVHFREYAAEVKEKYQTNVDTFRKGYIGKKASDDFGSEFVQVKRGRPYGYMASIFKDGKIYLGYVMIDPSEKFTHDMIGQGIALERAERNLADGITIEGILSGKAHGGINQYLDSESKTTLQYYYNRVRRYFMPDVYSYSRGTEPIKDPKFADIHAYQFAQAVIEAKTQHEFDYNLRRFKDMCLMLHPDFEDLNG